MKLVLFKATCCLCLGIGFIFSTGCVNGTKELDSRVSPSARVNLLEGAVESYAESLKWGFFEEIHQHQRAKGEAAVNFSLESIGRHRIIFYENLSKLLSQDGITARVVAKIEYYEIDTGLLYTKFFDQNWWYDGISDRWYIASSVPSLQLPQ